MEEKAQAFGTLVLMQNPLFQSFHQTQSANMPCRFLSQPSYIFSLILPLVLKQNLAHNHNRFYFPVD